MFILCLVFIISSCNMPFLSGTNTQEGDGDQTGGEPQVIIVENGETVPEQGAAPEESTAPEEGSGAKKDIDPNPVGLQDGLGSLDSYNLTIQIKSHDEKGSINEMSSYIQRSEVDKSSYTKRESKTFDPDEDEEVNSDTIETYSVNNATCSFDGDEYDYEELSDQDKEMRDIFSSMVDFIPLIDDPVFLGEESMNGIQCNHFTFKVTGIGDNSGSVATINEGEYWLAVDGQYIVRYSLKLEVRSGAEGTEGAEVSYLESYMDLTDVNVPVSVTLPPECFIVDEYD